MVTNVETMDWLQVGDSGKSLFEMRLRAVSVLLMFSSCFWFNSNAQDQFPVCKLDDDVAPVFTSPLDQSQDMTHEICKEQCSQSDFLYAGLANGDTCYCAHTMPDTNADSCNEPCVGNPNQNCGGSVDLNSFTIVKGNVVKRTTELVLSASPEKCSVHEEIVFSYDTYDESAASYIMMYDDNDLQSLPNAKHRNSFIYHIPGTYEPTIEETIKQEVASDSTTVTVLSDPLLDINCTEHIIITGDPLICQVSILLGSSMELFLDLSDKSEEFNSVPDTYFASIGNAVPQFELNSVEKPKQSTPGPFYLPFDSKVKENGELFGFEIHMNFESDCEIVVASPSCPEGQSFCSEDQSCSTSECPQSCSSAFDPVINSCGSESNDIKLTEKISTGSMSISKGYQYKELDDKIYVQAGDVLAFKCDEKSVASRITIAEEVGDTLFQSFGGPSTQTTFRHYVRFFVTAPTNFEWEYNTEKPGNFSVNTVLMVETERKQQRSNDFLVRTPISDVQFSCSSSKLEVNETLTVTINVSEGSHLRFSCDFEENSVSDFQENLEQKPLQVEFDHIFESNGEFNVSMKVENELGNQGNWCSVQVFWSVTDNWQLNVESPQHENAEIELKFIGERLPKKFFIEYDWGDDTNPDAKEVNDEGKYNENHLYEENGNYSITVTIWNEISNHSVTSQVQILRTIKNFEILNITHRTAKDTEKKLGSGPNGNVFPVNATVYFNVKVSQGTVDKYVMEFKNSIVTKEFPPDADVFFVFIEPGEYNVILYARDSAGYCSNNVTAKIFISDLIKTIEIEDYEVNDINETKEFGIRLDDVPFGACLTVNISGSSELTSYGDSNFCQINASNAKYQGQLKESFNVSHIFQTRGVNHIEIVICNPRSCTRQQKTFIISPLNCTVAPELTFKPNQFPPNAPRIIERSQQVRFAVFTNYNCSVPVIITRIWRIWEINDTLHEIRNISLEKVPSVNKSILCLAPLFLTYGLYRLEYYSEITARDDPSYPYILRSETYVKITKSSLIASVLGGMQFIKVGYEQTIKLKPHIFSRDPDFPDDKNLTFHWCCNVVEDFEIPCPYWNLVKSNNSLSSSEQDAGGCFVWRKEADNLSNGNWQLNIKSFIMSNRKYRLYVKVTKDDREDIAWLEFSVVDGYVPIIEITCLQKRMCKFVGESKLKINLSNRLALRASCFERCHNNSKYFWKAKKDLQMISDEEFQNNVLGINSSEIAIYQGFFANSTNETYIFQVQVEYEGIVGEGEIQVYVNEPPSGGTCEFKGLSPYGDTAIVLLSEFHIECTDWSDEDGVQSFTFYITTISEEGVEKNIYLQYGNESEAKVILPCGKLYFHVNISDSLGAAAIFTFEKPIELKSCTWEELEHFKNNDWLNAIKNKGNQFRMVQIFNVIHKMKDCGPSPPEEKSGDDKLREQSNQIYKFLDGLEDITMEDMDGLNLVSSTISEIVGTGSLVDTRGREKSVNLVEKITTVLNNTDGSSSEEIYDVTQYTVGILGAIMKGQTETGLLQNTLPTDFDYINEVYYDTSVDEDFVMPDTVDGMQRFAIQSNQLFRSPDQLRQMRFLIRTLTKKVLQSMVVNEPPLQVTTESADAIFRVIDRSQTPTFEVGGAEFSLPNSCELRHLQVCDQQAVVGVAGYSWNAIAFAFGENLQNLGPSSKSITIVVSDESRNSKLKVGNLTTNVNLTILTLPNFNSTDSEPLLIQPKLKWYQLMMYHQITLEKQKAAVKLHLTPLDNSTNYLIFMKFNQKPFLNKYDFLFTFNQDNLENGTFSVFLDSETINGKTGKLYVGVTQLAEGVSSEDIKNQVNISESLIVKNFSSPYMFSLISTGCYFFNHFYRSWQWKGCEVIDITSEGTKCSCNHLTTFAGGLLVQPNSIDFAYVFANAGFADNLTIYCTIILTFVIYSAFLFWARKHDRQDSEKVGAIPLPDNNPQHKYLYELIFFTGHNRRAGTESKVSFILTGDKEESEIRNFGKPEGKFFRRDGTDCFVMSTARPLGQLLYLSIWHDNSGTQNWASWLLNVVIVRDVQTGEKFGFIVNKWLALEYDDGEIDRVIPVAGKEELTDFQHLFNTATHKNLSDGHLWFSVFLRPPRSRFTRCQRVSCCMAVLYLSMLVNAMWYGTVPDNPNTGLKIGPFSLSLEQISVGVFSNLIVFPPSFVIIFLFRKARPRNLRPSRITEALKKQMQTAENLPSKSQEAEDGKPSPKLYHRKKKFTLPWWCSIIAWALCIVCMVTSIFFLWAYGIQFGNQKTKNWLTSLIISFFASVFITQPIKVFLMAILFSSVCKKIETDEDDADEDEMDPDLQYDEEWVHHKKGAPKQRQLPFTKNAAKLEEAKITRQKEMRMWKILREVAVYLLFIWVLSIIGFTARDPNAFYLRKVVKDVFVESNIDPINSTDSFLQINNEESFWKWAHEVLLRNLRAQRQYNNEPPFGMKGFLRDGINRMIGNAILRQVRVKPGNCKVADFMSNVIFNCSGSNADPWKEDFHEYNPGWQEYHHQPLENKAQEKLVYSPYLPFNWMYSGNLFTFGKSGIYSGSGYVIELKSSLDNIKLQFQTLQEEGWIDKYTRSVFIEFTVYNANVNIFCAIQMIVEFFPGGGALPEYYMSTFKMFNYRDSMTGLIILAQVIFLIYLLCFSVQELREMCKQGKRYFISFWNLNELAIILLSCLCIAAFVIRTLALNDALKIFNETKGNKYVNMTLTAKADDLYCCIMSIVVFLGTIKFIKLLRFNSRMAALSSTLKRFSSDLIAFLVFFGIIFMAFGQLFHILFQTHLENFNTLMATIENMFAIILNKFDFQSYSDSQPLVGPIVFICFSYFGNLILINMFLSALILSFQTVKLDLEKSRNEYHMMSFFYQRIKIMFGVAPKPVILSESTQIKQSGTLSQTDGLPEKVDQLLKYINLTYFEGKMDLKNKQCLRELKRKKRSQFLKDKSIYEA